VTEGKAASADCTLTLTDADFFAMSTGKADPQKLFMGGKLQIAGNIMASQKLMFLKKIDPKAAEDAIAKARGAAPKAAAPAAPPAELGSRDIFAVIADYVSKHPELVKEVQTVFQFHLTSPDSAWVIDLKQGSVTEGKAASADCTLTLTDADFFAMSTGKADPQKLFLGGKLQIAGNIMASQKLLFLKKIDPKAATAAVEQARAAAAPAPAAAPAKAKESVAPSVFAALGKRLAAEPTDAGLVLQVVVKDAGSWVVDFRAGSAKVEAGKVETPDTVLELSDADLADLARGTVEARSLYQHGKLRVSGDVRGAHLLSGWKVLA
jgi:putative sterol carrier protein